MFKSFVQISFLSFYWHLEPDEKSRFKIIVVHSSILLGSEFSFRISLECRDFVCFLPLNRREFDENFVKISVLFLICNVFANTFSSSIEST